jgi:uncharacterized protein
MTTPSPPMPVQDPLSDFFWEGAAQGQLLIQRCQQCGTYIHLPRPICRNCQSFDLQPEPVSGRGTLYSYTVTYKAFHPAFVDQVPYVLASVVMDEQHDLRVLSNLVDVPLDAIHIGMPVQVAFRQLAPELTVPVFVAAEEG